MNASNENKIKIKAEKICFFEKMIEMEVTLSTNDTLTHLSNEYRLVIVNRENGKELQYYCDIINSSEKKIILGANLNTNDIINIMDNSILDIYLLNLNINKKYRVRCNVFKYDEKIPRNKELKHTVEFYKTIKGNISIRSCNYGSGLTIDKMDLKKDGSLIIRGSIKKESLNISTNADINFTIERKYSMLIDPNYNSYVKILEKNINEYGLFFTIESNITDLNIDTNDEVNKLLLTLHIGDVEIKYEIKKIEKRINLDEVVYKNGKRYHYSLVSNKTPLKIGVKDKSDEIEVKAVYINENDIKLVLDNSNDFNTIEKKEKITPFIKKRNSDFMLEVDYEFDYDKYEISLKLKETLSKTKLDLGTYDIRIKKDNVLYRVATINDKIFTKKHCINFPRFNVVDEIGESLYFQAYYTEDNRIALKLKNTIEISKIQTKLITPRGLKLKGILYNRIKHIDEPKSISGVFYLDTNKRGPLDINYIGSVKLKNKNTGRCDFTIIIPTKELLTKKCCPIKISSALKNTQFKYSIRCNSNKSVCYFCQK